MAAGAWGSMVWMAASSPAMPGVFSRAGAILPLLAAAHLPGRQPYSPPHPQSAYALGSHESCGRSGCTGPPGVRPWAGARKPCTPSTCSSAWGAKARSIADRRGMSLTAPVSLFTCITLTSPEGPGQAPAPTAPNPTAPLPSTLQQGQAMSRLSPKPGRRPVRRDAPPPKP